MMQHVRRTFGAATRSRVRLAVRSSIVLLLACLTSLAPTSVQADVSAEQVKRAIDRGISFLRREQRTDGTWPDFTGYDDGVTSLCVLALVNAGVPADDPQIQRALQHLRDARPKMNYAVALQTMALCAAQPKRDMALIRENVKWFETNQLKLGRNKGGWSYPRGGGDNSNTQFALLALHEAERVGVPVSDNTWRLALAHWVDTQNKDGSWGYTPGEAGTGSMTSAGISSVVIASGRLNEPDVQLLGGQVRCCGDQASSAVVDNALNWLGRNFSVRTNSGRGNTWLLYNLYGIERVGRLTARRFIGEHDWYREGVAMLVETQDQLSGFWKNESHGESDPRVATSLALLFLSKGRRPVIAGKLAHGPDNDWNHHRADIANLTTYVEKRWQRDLTWQIISPQAATVDDLLQTPVLYISGREAPQFNDEETLRLREYVNQGGFIFAVACCDESGGFDQGFRQLMERVFPEAEYRLRLLPPEHPIWHAEEPIDAAHVAPLWGIDVGCRTSVVYSPQDLSCLWELSGPQRTAALPPDVLVNVTAANSIGANVLAYATNREVKYKYEITPLASANQNPQDPLDRARLEIAKLRHTGGWDTAPRALINLQEALAREAGVRTSTDRHDVALADPQLFAYPILFMHGRNDFRLSAAERSHLREFVERGGFLLADSVCGSEAFTRAFQREMAATFPETPLAPIPANDPLLTAAFGGFDLKTVTRRQPRRAEADKPITVELRIVPPELQGIKVGDRWGVVFSPYDLSCALERQESLQCAGYTREDAARIAINAMLYGLQQ
ncbi:MAG: DUF4159 domain-containing protein [Pirellulales bacterium]|nr:DUF4159 domain-containing protein [Pirellulales bacterium]